jgi:hypothetical protein
MKLIRTDKDQFEFEIGPGEKVRMFQILKLYPLVPASHPKLSKGRKIPNHEENQRLLDEALRGQREENRKQAESLLNEPRRIVKFESGYRVTFTRVEIEWLLQVFNDVRIGSWIALGSPDPHPEIQEGMSHQIISQIVTMELAAFFEMCFLHAVSGEKQPGYE